MLCRDLAGRKSRCMGQVKLHRRCLAKLRKHDEHDTNRTFAITLAWLQLKDRGNTLITLERLWKRVRDSLQTIKARRRLLVLTEHLAQSGTLTERAGTEPLPVLAQQWYPHRRAHTGGACTVCPSFIPAQFHGANGGLLSEYRPTKLAAVPSRDQKKHRQT